MNLKPKIKVKIGDKVVLTNDPKHIYEVIKIENKLITVFRDDRMSIAYKKVSPHWIKEIINE